jgi:hypothetical protein
MGDEGPRRDKPVDHQFCSGHLSDPPWKRGYSRRIDTRMSRPLKPSAAPSTNGGNLVARAPVG